METPLPPVVELPPSRPLLPPLLQAPAAFLWLWLLPLGIMLGLNLQGYWLVEGNMDETQRHWALILGLAGLTNIFVGLVWYFLARREARRATPRKWWTMTWGLTVIGVQVAYLWSAVALMDDIIPRSVLAWIYPDTRFMFNQFSFAMLPLFWGVLVVSCIRPAGNAAKTIAVGLGLAVGAPVSLYLLFMLIARVGTGWHIPAIIFVTMIVVLGLMMFFGVVRALMFAFGSLQRRGTAMERIAILVVALVLPICGLLLNISIPFPVDFQALEVYVLVVVNGGILFFASYQSARWPRVSFALLWMTFPFSLYYFVVFLPYTPLSILGIIVVGAGFLVLTPTLLFVLHLHLLNQARIQPLFGGGLGLRMLIAGVAFLVLPAFFTVRALGDKAALNAALDYVYAPRVSAGPVVYPANLSNLHRALRSHRDYKNGIYYPFLSDYYSWLVFDGLVLPDEKLNRLLEIFSDGRGSSRWEDPVRKGAGFSRGSVHDRSMMPRSPKPPRTVEVSDLAVRVRPSDATDSIVTMKLMLANTGTQPAEYVANFLLPAGIHVSGFRLNIKGTPVPGRIFEKKTALWVYTMIRDSERRDPGLLIYNTPAELELRVFPVAASEKSVVEVDFLVPAQIDAERLPAQARDPAEFLSELGRRMTPRMTANDRGVLVTGLDVHSLPVVDRETYLHVIIDRSIGNGFDGDLPAALRFLREKFPTARRARITLANYDVAPLVTKLTPIDELIANPPSKWGATLPLAGGLFADFALARSIQEHRDSDLDGTRADSAPPPRPIFVVVNRKAATHASQLRLAQDWLDILPAFELFELDLSGTLVEQQPWRGHPVPLLRMGSSMRPIVTREPTRFETATGKNILEFYSPTTRDWQPVPHVEVNSSTATLNGQAVSLQLQQQDYARSPGGAGVDLKGLVKESRATGILLPSTSYIVVENSAQWKMLELSERTKLGQNAALDFLETPAPPMAYLVIGFGAWLGFRRWRNTRKA